MAVLTSTQKLTEKVKGLLTANLLLSAPEKAKWLSRLNGLDVVELEGLLALLTRSDQEFKGFLGECFKKDTEDKIMTQWKNFKKEKMRSLSDQVHNQEAKKAEREMQQKLK